jgi:hypothetical protein
MDQRRKVAEGQSIVDDAGRSIVTPGWMPQLHRWDHNAQVSSYPQDTLKQWGPPNTPHMRVSERHGPRLKLFCENCKQEKWNALFFSVDYCFQCMRETLLQESVDLFGIARFWWQATVPAIGNHMWDEELLYRQYGWWAVKLNLSVVPLPSFHPLTDAIVQQTGMDMEVLKRWNGRIQDIEYSYRGRRFAFADQELAEAIAAGLARDPEKKDNLWEPVHLW